MALDNDEVAFHFPITPTKADSVSAEPSSQFLNLQVLDLCSNCIVETLSTLNLPPYLLELNPDLRFLYMAWEFPKIRATLFWGVRIIRILVFRLLFWGSPIFGNSHAHVKTLFHVMRLPCSRRSNPLAATVHRRTLNLES